MVAAPRAGRRLVDKPSGIVMVVALYAVEIAALWHLVS